MKAKRRTPEKSIEVARSRHDNRADDKPDTFLKRIEEFEMYGMKRYGVIIFDLESWYKFKYSIK